MQRSDLLVWIDLEMTGLDPRTDLITEIATIITDSSLDIIAEGPDLVVHLEEAVLQPFVERKDWPIGANFAQEIRKSALEIAEVERQTLDFITAYVTPKSSPLCGNTIHMDRFFIKYQMPSITDYLHYRNIDVSTVKELARRWRPDICEEAESRKKLRHRAKDDILESIAELRFYKENFFNNPQEAGL